MVDERTHATELTRTLSERLVAGVGDHDGVTRRAVLGGLGVAGAGALGVAGRTQGSVGRDGEADAHGNFGAVGEYQDPDFDPHEFLREFNTGFGGTESISEEAQEVYERDDGNGGTERVREFDVVARRNTIQIAPGIEFDAWTYNDQVPGPTLRVTEGDVIRVNFENLQDHPHTIHPHVKNVDPEMDGIPQNGPGLLDQGDTFTYEWTAEPAGVHFYHCHSMPLKEHVHRGLYGLLIVDPDPERVREHPRDYVNYQGPIDEEYRQDLVERAELRNHEYRADEVDEMVMVMNGFDTNFDGDNEVYAANTQAFCYGVADTDGQGSWDAGETIKPIQIDRNQRQRVYLLNTIEFDLVNSIHTHSQFFDYYDHGTTLYPTHKTVDTIMQCQAQRGIVELDYGDHQSEFAELGWMSFFEVA